MKKKAASKIESSPISALPAEFQLLALAKVQPSGNNYRKTLDKSALADLTASVKSKGVLQPILVRPLNGNGTYEIVAGHRRYQAATSAGLSEIPAIVKPLTDEEALECQVIENSQREDPNVMEEAWGFDRLLKIGKHTPDTLAEKLDRSVDYVIKRVKLLELPKAAQDKLLSGEITQGHALLIARLRDPKDQKELISQISERDGGMTIKSAADFVRRHLSMQLKEALFDTAGCETCPFRSRNQVALFSDLKNTDECVDRNCFTEKTKQHYLALIKAKEKAGHKTFTKKKDIEKYVSHSAKGSCCIESPGSNVHYAFRQEKANKYKSECTKCIEHRAFFYYEEKTYSGRMDHYFGEICLKKSCLQKMNKVAGPKNAPADRRTPEQIAEDRQYQLAEDCFDRFLTQRFVSAVKSSDTLGDIMGISLIMGGMAYRGQMKLSQTLGLKGMYGGSAQIVKAFLAANPDKSPRALVEELFSHALLHMDDDIKFNTLTKNGIDIRKEFTIDEEYLTGLTLDQLKTIEKDFSMDLHADTKEAYVKALLSKGPQKLLKGYLPAGIEDILSELEVENAMDEATNEPSSEEQEDEE